jgi:uncharacterized protein YgiM (DUF1202 family)
VTASQALHVRREPNGVVIGYLYREDEVTLTGQCSDGWAQIKYKDRSAWVRAKYLSDNLCKE